VLYPGTSNTATRVCACVCETGTSAHVRPFVRYARASSRVHTAGYAHAWAQRITCNYGSCHPPCLVPVPRVSPVECPRHAWRKGREHDRATCVDNETLRTPVVLPRRAWCHDKRRGVIKHHPNAETVPVRRGTRSTDRRRNCANGAVTSDKFRRSSVLR